MKISRIVILLTLLGISVGLSAGGFALSGIGSRAISMGGAFRGMADDASAMYWNPAGLAFLDHNEISLGGNAIQPGSKFKNTNALLPGFTTTEIEAENKLRAFPNLMGVLNNSDIAWGLGAYVPYGLGSTWDLYNMPSAFPHPDTLLDGSAVNIVLPSGMEENEMSSSVAVVDIHPTVAYKLADNFSFGLGLSVFYGQIDLAQVKPHAVYSYTMPTTFDMSGTGLGIGGNLGLMYKPWKNLSLGLNGRAPSNIFMEGDANIKLWLNNYYNYVVWGGNNAFYVPQVYGGKSDIDATLKLPAEIGGGLSWDIKPCWTVNLDYAYTMWERLDAIKVEMDTPITILAGHPTLQNTVGSTTLTFNWKDTNRVSLGTEYRFGSSALRAGAYYDQTPIGKDVQLPTLSDTGDKISGNLGFGQSFGPVTIDLNGQYIYFPEREVTAQTATNMVGVYNSSVIAGNLNLSFKF